MRLPRLALAVREYSFDHGDLRNCYSMMLMKSGYSIAEQLKAIFGQNRSFDDTSMRFGKNVLLGSHFYSDAKERIRYHRC